MLMVLTGSPASVRTRRWAIRINPFRTVPGPHQAAATVDVTEVEGVDSDVDRRMYVGVVARMMMSGPVLMLAFVLPKVAPLDWAAVAAGLALFGLLACFGAVGMRWPHLRSRPAFVLTSIVVATTAVGMAIVASRDPATAAPFALLAAMAFQLNTRRPLAFVLFAWVVGSAVFAASQTALGVPGAHVVTHTTMFAGLTGVVLATIRFLVEETHANRRDAESLADLARLAAAARDLDEAIDGAQPMIARLTGATRTQCIRSETRSSGQEHPPHLVELGSTGQGPVALGMWGVTRPTFVPAVTDLLVQVCERERILAELVRHSRTDPVTGVANRRGLDELIGSAPGGVTRTVAMLDLDHFKAFNDLHGHLAGDDLLGRFARVLEQQVRPGDHVSRYGGEEFCLVLDADVAVATVIVERIRAAWTAEGLPVTFSAGLAAERTGVPDPTADALSRADRALYQAKELGRDRVVVAGTS
jgi:diguanylate cyclase (GGDEF)-like protein